MDHSEYQALRALFRESKAAPPKEKIRAFIAELLGVGESEVSGVEVVKWGMTNRSVLFRCGTTRCILRIPGEGTESLIDRAQEADVYRVISGRGLCDDPISLDPATGCKVSLFTPDSRVCDPQSESDLLPCMKKLREFHEMRLRVDHEFRLFEQIDRYRALWTRERSIYPDYEQTRRQVFSLRPFLEKNGRPKTLAHIDPNPDNFLLLEGEDGGQVQLIDWEYAGMHDPDIDLAMFCIYAMYEREDIDRLIDCYYAEGCPELRRTVIYAYIAACGLLWSNWCEYKSDRGVEFGEYSLRQYQYAREYYRIARKRIEEAEREAEDGADC